MLHQLYFCAVYRFPLYEPDFDFIQETVLIIDECFTNEIFSAAMFFFYYKV